LASIGQPLCLEGFTNFLLDGLHEEFVNVWIMKNLKKFSLVVYMLLMLLQSNKFSVLLKLLMRSGTLV
jgi:hypothetical protein